MSLDSFLLMLLMVILSLGGVILLFLPSIIEIRKPRDKGPRKILRKPLRESLRCTPLILTSQQDSTYSRSFSQVVLKTGVRAQRIGNNTIRIFGDVTLPPKHEFSDNVVVHGALTVGDYCVFHGSIKAEGNVSIGNCVVISGNLVSKLNVEIMDDAIVAGSLHADGSVRLGERVFVGSAVVAGADVELYENSEVKRNILTNGVIRMLRSPRVDWSSALEDIE